MTLFCNKYITKISFDCKSVFENGPICIQLDCNLVNAEANESE